MWNIYIYMGVSKNSWYPQIIHFGVPLFLETPIYMYIYIYVYIYISYMYLSTFNGGVSKWLKMEAITFCLDYNVVTLDY